MRYLIFLIIIAVLFVPACKKNSTTPIFTNYGYWRIADSTYYAKSYNQSDNPSRIKFYNDTMVSPYLVGFVWGGSPFPGFGNYSIDTIQSQPYFTISVQKGNKFFQSYISNNTIRITAYKDPFNDNTNLTVSPISLYALNPDYTVNLSDSINFSASLIFYNFE